MRTEGFGALSGDSIFNNCRPIGNHDWKLCAQKCCSCAVECCSWVLVTESMESEDVGFGKLSGGSSHVSVA